MHYKNYIHVWYTLKYNEFNIDIQLISYGLLPKA